jgi:galactarate dehydratase
MTLNKPLKIKMQGTDNVAVIANEGGLKAGTVFEDGFTLTTDVPQAHKAALVDIPKGRGIVRYGQIIGYAKKDIPKGSWIDESLVGLPPAVDVHQLVYKQAEIPAREPLKGLTFQGYKNPDGSVGVLNLLGIHTSVQCTAGVLDLAVKKIREELLPKYPHVDGVVALKHAYGCGVAINAPEAKVPIRTIKNLAKHPNLGGELLIVSLGCEKLRPEVVIDGNPRAVEIVLQDKAGMAASVAAIVQAAEPILERLNKRTRVTCPAADLVIGLQCGGSDAFSGVTSNPAVGYAADLLERAGATVMFSEVTEVRDGVDRLLPRCANAKVGKRLLEEMQWYDNYLTMGGVDRAANTTPGNKKGGLSNIVEKAMGSIIKSGTGTINEVLSPAKRPTKKGLIYAATPASDFVCGTCQLASGIQMQVFTTGRGTPYGLAMAPVIKVCSRSAVAKHWPDIIDVNAGRIAEGDATIESVGKEIFALILAVASGEKQTWAQKWKIYNDLCVFNPAPIT